MEVVASRRSLGEFLRIRRERLTPEEVGLVSYGRRRTAGLRREEVAQLAHIGTSWYTSLEQGRSVNPSEDVLNNIAKALRLTEDERRHLHLLARSDQQEPEEEDRDIATGLERMIQALDPHPAFVLGRYWDLLLWNKAAELVFHVPAFSKDTMPNFNWMRHLLTSDKLGPDLMDGASRTRVLIAQFRADFARFPNDARFKTLIEEFMEISPLFRELWPMHDVETATDHRKQKYDPRIGEMAFEHLTLQPPTHPDLKVIVFTASADTAARLQRLLDASEG
ncbi:helix-turn-helix transcriptional regulator [Cohnella hashimotonis]|uniref:Helix-turn-helix transcriptional regulator n=1 Tax=Cohnella hashimotonis TaxID=2826895 RepID=A0ABT6TQV8_9BACL|nr:helix-turn-helix transcriptional regulator [Cohnella hashimotonis]MDI4649218.1 helix-turn-helix transcriptional regulator [Cohnella hashimotonis]